MRILTLIVAIPLLVSNEAALAQVVFKCVDAASTTIFSQSPCAVNAEKVYVEDASSGMLSPNSGRNEQIYERAEQFFEQSRQSNTTTGHRKKGVVMRGRGLGSGLTLDGRDKQQVTAQRDRNRGYDKAIRNVRGSGAHAQCLRASLAAAKYGNKSMDCSYLISNPAYIATPATPIPSNRGGFYYPTGPDGSQYLAPGGGVCNREGTNLNCAGVVKSANGVVIEPHK